MWAGGLRVTNNSASAASTSSLRRRRATGSARHSLLASSMIDRMRNLRPSCVRPSTDSKRSGEGQAKHGQLVGPYVTRIFRPQPDKRSIIEPEPRAFRLLLRHLEPLAPPDVLHPLAVHMPPRITQQGRHPAIAITTILPSQGDNVFGQGGFVICPVRHLALGRSMLPEHAAHPPLGDNHHSSDVIDTAPTPCGAQKFVHAHVLRLPRAASCSISLSSVRSDTARRSRWFSSSSPLATPPFRSFGEPGPSSTRHTRCASGSSSVR